MLLWGIILILY